MSAFFTDALTVAQDVDAAKSSDLHGTHEQSPALIRTEANFLRFPLFALHTKGLKSLDGIECRGRIRREGIVREYTLRITRNTASLYPGLLSRRLHFALLSIATERGFPLQNPISWVWRDLCRRMGIAYGGNTTLRQLKAALRSTHGIILHTEEALFSKDDRQALPSLERGYHLYDTFIFKNNPLPSGETADRNAVWLADWYLANLNALHSAPLDYTLWQALDQRSPIASRLYEFLFLNFHSNSPIIRIDYRNLAQLLPIKQELFVSQAKKQLQPALEMLATAGILGQAAWEEGKEKQIQLHFRRGLRLYAGIPRADRPLPTMTEEEVQMRELRNTKTPEWFLVREFHQLLTGDANALVKPTPKELSLAQDLIETHGQSKLQLLIPELVKHLRLKWPDAKTFGAAAYYLPEALHEVERHERSRHQAREEQERQSKEEQERTQKAKEQAAWKAVWDGLPEGEREHIRCTVLKHQPRSLEKYPKALLQLCLAELARTTEQRSSHHHETKKGSAFAQGEPSEIQRSDGAALQFVDMEKITKPDMRPAR